ncbi:MAG: flagellar basal body rod protein FlgB [Candidatus Binatia bacterium]
MPGILFDPTLEGLARALTLHQRRHEVLAANVANVETPGYRARELDFKAALRSAFEARPADAALEAATPPSAPIIDDPSAPVRADGNTVDVDLQMAKLSANGGNYVALARILGRRVALLRQAIEGTR